MSNEAVETIDSSQAQILADFGFADEPINNIEHYFLGVLGEKFITRMRDLAGNERGKVFFDRANYLKVIEKIEDAYAGKLRETNQDFLKVENGNDELFVGIVSTFPHASTRPIEKFYLQNNRSASLDGLKSDRWDLYMSTETGRKLLAEMKRIQQQVLNY